MTTITVQTEAEAETILARIERILNSADTWRKLFGEIFQDGFWRDWITHRFDVRFEAAGLIHAPATIKQRSRRTGYYLNQPSPRARSDHPYFEWTGFLRQAFTVPTEINDFEAVVDPNRNYRGPIPGSQVVSTVMGPIVPSDHVFGDPPLDPLIDRFLERELVA